MAITTIPKAENKTSSRDGKIYSTALKYLKLKINKEHAYRQ